MNEAITQLWGEVLDYDTRSWTECFTKEDLLGGPSGNGNSWWTAFEKCAHYFNVVSNLRWRTKIRPRGLEVGGLFHEARALFYQAAQDGASDEECIERMFSVVSTCEDHVPHTASEVRRLLSGWLKAHGPGMRTDDRSETLLVEPLIRINKVVPYSTRWDRVTLSEEYGGPVIMEIKSTARHTKKLLQSYSVDPQFLGQQYCWRESEYCDEYGPLAAFIVDLAVKGKQQQFPRIVQPIDDEIIDDWFRAKCETWIQMQRCKSRNYWPRNRANCVQWDVICPLHQHCSIIGKGNEPFPGWVKKSVSEY